MLNFRLDALRLRALVLRPLVAVVLLAVVVPACGDDSGIGPGGVPNDDAVDTSGNVGETVVNDGAGPDAVGNDVLVLDGATKDELTDTIQLDVLPDVLVDIAPDVPPPDSDDITPDVPVVPCPALSAPQHAAIAISGSGTTLSVTFSCDPGYSLNGADTLNCQADGNWSSTPPTCDPVDCGALTAPTNGSVSAATTTLGASASYSCSGGFALSGSASRTCQANGSWSGTAPTCNAVSSCAGAPCQNGSTCTDLSPGYSCACQPGWTGANCDVPVDCGPLANPDSGTVQVSKTTNGGTATYSCVAGFVLSGNGGNGVRTCQADGTWTGTAPTCAPITCPAGNPPANGNVAPANPVYGAEADYTCNGGYVLVGAAARTCQVDGTLSGAVPLCNPVTCTTSAPANGTVSDTSVTYQGQVNYGCNTGYQIGSGDAQRTCQADGTFSGAQPTCIPATGGCDGNPCGVHSTGCTATGATTFTCACQPGWGGSDCNAPIDCGALANPANRY